MAEAMAPDGGSTPPHAHDPDAIRVDVVVMGGADVHFKAILQAAYAKENSFPVKVGSTARMSGASSDFCSPTCLLCLCRHPPKPSGEKKLGVSFSLSESLLLESKGSLLTPLLAFGTHVIHQLTHSHPWALLPITMHSCSPGRFLHSGGVAGHRRV
jgi:hypothetical protein